MSSTLSESMAGVVNPILKVSEAWAGAVHLCQYNSKSRIGPLRTSPNRAQACSITLRMNPWTSPNRRQARHIRVSTTPNLSLTSPNRAQARSITLRMNPWTSPNC